MAGSSSLMLLAALIPALAALLLYSVPLQEALPLSLTRWTSGRPAVTVGQGTLVGTVLSQSSLPVAVEAFLGVPYAEPPTGQLRFARPVPIKNSTQTLDASKYGNRCPGKQLLNVTSGVLPESEDCLTLNVFRQKGSRNASLPVAVYMHGGAFNRGNAKMHDTASMVAWSSEPFVAVSFNYRISALGFLNNAVTAKEGLLNVGLRDQELLLEWVQQNIRAFGGDPDNVTIIGLSAGAHSIGHHVMNVKQKKTLFHKAVMESGGPTSRAVHPFDSKLHEAQFRELLVEVGCEKAAEAEVLDCLRAVPSETFIAGQLAVFTKYNPSVRWAWQPVIDNDIISRRPLDAWKSGDWHKVPLLVGFNHNEGTMYVPKTMDKSAEFTSFFATLLPQLSGSDLKALDKLYPDPAVDPSSPYVETRDAPVGAQYKRVEAAYGQYAYVCPARQTARLASAAPENPPVYLYHWALNSSMIGGANHGDQMWYETMSESVRKVSATHETIAGYFHGYVTSFIISGDPNAVGGRYAERPRWGGFGEEGKTMVVGEGNDERAGGTDAGVAAQLVEDGWAAEQCEFWWKQSANPED